MIVGVIISGIVVIACKKDAYTTKPQLKYKSENSRFVTTASTLTFTLEVTDKEGDIVEDTIWASKHSLHCSAPDDDPYPYLIPSTLPQTKDLKADIEFTFSTAPKCALGLGNNDDDSCYFKFWIIDKARNVSDTVSSPLIIIR
ncbi:hypothetical protein FLA_3526 [Filimonas lacunae]|nr:hypothetical protein FLA_3526 [Filimonas lacunae]